MGRSLHAGRPAILLIAALVLAGPTKAAPSIDDPVARLQRTDLANGMQVLTLEDHTTPVVAFQMWVKAGSRDESFYTGIAHLFEHMMFKGSKNMGPEEHARWIGSRGGRINAFTSRDVTVYHEDVTSESLPLVIDLEAERLAHLDISEETLGTEREVVLEERRLRVEDSPSGLAFEALSALLWKAHPYRWPVIGWRADVEQVTVEACRAFFDTYYAANNIVLVIVGDFETEETLVHIERAFGGIPAAPEIPRNPTTVVDQRGERRASIVDDVKIPLIYAAYHAPASGHEDGEALDVASQILSGGRSSRMYRQLVYDAQQALYAQGGYWEFKDAGMFYAVAGVRPGVDVDEVEEALFAEIDRIRDEGVSDEEVAKAITQLEVSLVRGLDTAHALADRIGREMVFFGRVRSLDERMAAIAGVTAEDVQRVAQKYLVPEKRSVIQLLPAPPPLAAADEGETR